MDARGSRAITDHGAAHLLTGIGATRKSSFLREHHFDAALLVSDVDAIAFCRMLRDDTGLMVGGSSGGILAGYTAALMGEMALFRRPGGVLPDGGSHYRSTLYDDEWLAARGVLRRVRAAIAAAPAAWLVF